MAMATAQGHVRARPAISYCMYLLFFVITMAVVNEPALGKADHDHPPSTLELYFLLEGTIVVSASPSGSYNGSEYGSISIFNNFARETEAADSTLLGQAIGQAIRAKDGSQFVSFTYVLNITGYAGSITGQGVSNSLGTGKLAITGGTDDFLSAKGYLDALVINPGLLKSTLHIQYD